MPLKLTDKSQKRNKMTKFQEKLSIFINASKI